jgi:serine/threonine protein kinase
MQEHFRKPLAAGHLIGGYSIVRVIGQGGFGIVYEAVNEYTRERVAIKQFYPNSIASWRYGTIVVNKEDDKELVEKILKRFQEEAALQFSFNHPNILKVKNFVPADNTGYMISEYIDGKSLVEYLKQYGSVFPDEETFRRMMEPILGALAYVHEKLTLHRDISPDNIMIDNFGKAILVDFGAAKLDLRRSPSASSIVAFREEYAPLEQQVPSDERPEGYYTDIFAMAGTMYRLLNGKPPARAIERQLAGKDPYIPIALASKIKCSPAIYEGIDRGLSMAVKDRPATVEHFAHMLGWGTEAPPPPPPPEPAPLLEAPEPPTLPEVLQEVLEQLPSPEKVPSTQPAPRPSRWWSFLGIVLFLAGICFLLIRSESNPTYTAPSVSSPSYTTFANSDIDGGDLAGPVPHLRDDSREACLSACNEAAGCVGFSYGKWERICHLKQNLTRLRLEPGSVALLRSDQRVPPNSSSAKTMQRVFETLFGNRYSISPSRSRQACSDVCEREDSCVGYQHTEGECSRYDQIDSVMKNQTAQSGIKRQPP